MNGDIVVEKFYFLEERKEAPLNEDCIWQGRPDFLSYMLTKEFLEIFVLLFIFWYFKFRFLIFTNLFLLLFTVLLGINLYQYVTTKYFITLTHFVLRRGSKYYYYPISKLDSNDFRVHFNIFDFLLNCKTITYAYYKLSDVLERKWVVLHRKSTGNSNIWYQKARFSHVRDYNYIYISICKALEKQKTEKLSNL